MVGRATRWLFVGVASLAVVVVVVVRCDAAVGCAGVPGLPVGAPSAGLAACGGFRGAPGRAEWTGCAGNETRVLRCESTGNMSPCYCLVDGAHRAFFLSGEELPLTVRVDAERVAGAQCRW